MKKIKKKRIKVNGGMPKPLPPVQVVEDAVLAISQIQPDSEVEKIIKAFKAKFKEDFGYENYDPDLGILY